MRAVELQEGTMGRRYSGTRSISLTEQEVVQLIKEKCTEALKGTPIYRGSKSKVPFVKLSTEDAQPRLSANTHSYGNLLIDNLPEWVNYPKRSKSVICTNSYNVASWYGSDIYQVFPVNGTKVGVCPKDDLWFSFKLPVHYNNIANFNESLALAGTLALGRKPNEKNYQSFLKDLAHISDWLSDNNAEASVEKNRCQGLIKTLGLPLQDGLSKTFNPNTNGFTLTGIEGIPEGRNEIWLEGTAYLVRESLVEGLGLK